MVLATTAGGDGAVGADGKGRAQFEKKIDPGAPGPLQTAGRLRLELAEEDRSGIDRRGSALGVHRGETQPHSDRVEWIGENHNSEKCGLPGSAGRQECSVSTGLGIDFRSELREPAVAQAEASRLRTSRCYVHRRGWIFGL